MTDHTVLRGAFICALVTTLAACGGSSAAAAGATSTTSATVSSSSNSSSTSTTSALVALSSSTYTVAASSTAAVVTVNRVGGTAGVATVAYTTINGTATGGKDYSPMSGTLTWGAGDTAAKNIIVPVNAKAGGKNFRVALTSVAGAATFGSPISAAILMSGSIGATAAISTAGASALSISVQGNRLVNAQGNTLQLRGANISGLESGIIYGGGTNYWASAGLRGRPDFTKLAAWKMNVVRLPLNEDSWLGKSVSGMPGNSFALNGAGYQAEVAASVAAANAAGLYVILDLHWTAPASFAANEQNPMMDADNSIAFWTSVANAFKGNPAVMFELFNEPYIFNPSVSNGAFPVVTNAHPDAAANAILRNGGLAIRVFGTSDGGYRGVKIGASYTWQTAGYQTVIEAIRATGATNVIVCGGNRWSSDLSWWGQNPPVDPLNQLAAALHAYPVGNSRFPDSASAMLAPIVSAHPLIVTELGDEIYAHPAPFATKVLAWADANGYSVTAWTWNPWGGSNTLIQNASNYAPTAGLGQTYHDWTVNHR
jgi:endoglucanase